MLKETPRSLRQYFALMAILSFLPPVSGAVRGSFSSLAAPLSLVNLAFGLLFTFIALRFHNLLPKPKFIQTILLLCGVWTVGSFGWSLRAGATTSSVLGFVLSILILVYLMKSVARLSREVASSRVQSN